MEFSDRRPLVTRLVRCHETGNEVSLDRDGLSGCQRHLVAGHTPSRVVDVREHEVVGQLVLQGCGVLAKDIVKLMRAISYALKQSSVFAPNSPVRDPTNGQHCV